MAEKTRMLILRHGKTENGGFVLLKTLIMSLFIVVLMAGLVYCFSLILLETGKLNTRVSNIMEKQNLKVENEIK